MEEVLCVSKIGLRSRCDGVGVMERVTYMNILNLVIKIFLYLNCEMRGIIKILEIRVIKLRISDFVIFRIFMCRLKNFLRYYRVCVFYLVGGRNVFLVLIN